MHYCRLFLKKLKTLNKDFRKSLKTLFKDFSYLRSFGGFGDFLVVGNHRPVLDSGEKLCTSCFGKGDKLVAEATALASDLDSPSSVSSSTSLGSPSSDED